MYKKNDKIKQKPPSVRKASEYFSGKSNRHKKYVSLMLVPSYSGGKTRSLRLPRIVFHAVWVAAALAAAAIAALYLRGARLSEVAEGLSHELNETHEVLTDLIEGTDRMRDELSESVNHLNELHNQERQLLERRHGYALEDIWDLIEEIERRIRDLQGNRRHEIDELKAFAFIPQVESGLAEIAGMEARIGSGLEAGGALSAARALSSAFAGHGAEERLIAERLFGMEKALSAEEAIGAEWASLRGGMRLYADNFPAIRPAEGVVSSPFGSRVSVFRPWSHLHRGIDIAAPVGTPVIATGGGTVVFSGWLNEYGNAVKIDHGIGIVTLYAHNSRNLVAEGEAVARGQAIALVGSTGQSTGPHVHYEVLVDGVAVNPARFFLMEWDGNPLSGP